MPIRRHKNPTGPGREHRPDLVVGATSTDEYTQRVHRSWKWRKHSERYRAKNPLCCDPFGIHARQGMPVPAHTVDHIVPLSQGGHAWEDSNKRSLCWSCHGRVSQAQGQEKRQ